MRYLVLIFMFTYCQGSGQNLIPNPYFDHVRDCSGYSPINYFRDWHTPTSSKKNRPFHPCLDNIPFSPYGVNHQKYQKAGKGMISILLLSDENKEYKSYIATPLTKTLQQDISYYVYFYISPKKRQNDSRSMVTNVMGMYLTSEKVQEDILTTLPFTPQIERRGTFFDNFDHWYKIQGKYIAKGGEKYAIIGNFRSDRESSYKYLNPASGSVPNSAQVFIDDVLIEAFDPLPDTIMMCDHQPIHLNAGFHDATYQWNTGERDSMITASRSGKYKVKATIDTLVFVDSTTVIYMNEFSTHTTVDTFFCQGSELVLRPPVPGRYQWHTGETESIRTIQDAGTYPLTVENECGVYRFTYEISERDCDCDLVFPTAFSPNGDNRNDYFMVIDQCRYRAWTLESFRVYDKWGGKVYEESGPSVNWNGQGSDGRRLSPGVYTYRLEVNLQEGSGEESIIKMGSVQLIR